MIGNYWPDPHDRLCRIFEDIARLDREIVAALEPIQAALAVLRDAVGQARNVLLVDIHFGA